MNYNAVDINEKALYVLKINESNRFETEYLKINDDLIDELNLSQLYELIDTKFPDDEDDAKLLYENKGEAVLNFFSYIYDNYKDFFGDRNYCSRGALKSSFCEFKPIYNPDELKLVEYNSSSKNSLYISINKNRNLCNHFIHDFLYSYFIKTAYEECNSKTEIKAYSHRRVGWSCYKYKLNDILSVEIATNFGFGFSSYFTLTLLYDDIEIIPYSRLVLYHYTNTCQLIKYTREYNVNDYSWIMALDFVRDVTNDFLDNGHKSFISNYVISECEKLVEILPQYLINDTFNLSENKNGTIFHRVDEFEKVKLSGIELMLFRGEKISGAVDFTDSIIKLNKLFPTTKYIEAINSCCKKVIPMLNISISNYSNTLKSDEKKLSNDEIKINTLQSQHSIIETRVNNYNKIDIEKRKEIFESMKNDSNITSINSSIIIELTFRRSFFVIPQALNAC